MKKLKLCLIAMATFCLGAQSVSAATEITSGSIYYIQNVGSKLYLGSANNWGTRASVSVQGDKFKLDGSDGVYTIADWDLGSSANRLGDDLYTGNTGSGYNWTIEAVGDGSFTIKNDNGYLAQNNSEKGCHIGYVVKQVEEAQIADSAKWYIITRDEAIAKLKAATGTSPVDASFLIGNANFSRFHNSAVWTQTSGSFNLSGGSNDNKCAESYHIDFDLNQKIMGIPNGIYGMTAQGFYRQDGTDNDNLPVFYMNDETKTLPIKTGNENSTTKASASFSAGSYTIDEFKVTVTDGTLKIGVKNENMSLWCVWDNFQLKYYGAGSDGAAKNALDEQVTKAQAISGKMNATVASDLSSAITTAQSASTDEEISSATTTIKAAIAAANASIKVYSAINDLIASNATNATTLDADGQAAYDVTAVQSAYDNGTITDGVTEKAALKTALQTAAKAQTTEGADMTLAISNWDFIDCTNDNFTDWNIYAPNGGNCWKNGTSSVEYWTGTAANGQFDYSQVITDLPKGIYQLTAKMWNTMDNVNGTFAANSGVYGMTSDGAYNYGLVTEDINKGSMKEYSTDQFIVNDGQLTVGVKNSTTMVARWFGVDYIKLTYLGNLDSYYSAIADLLKTAIAITDPQKATASALATAISNANGYESNINIAELQAIKAGLISAVEVSQASVKAYANAASCLPQMKMLVDATNVYTADALNTYYTEPKTKYDDGTLTTDEAAALQNPATVTDWHAAITCDNFLLSAWDTNPDFTDAPYYINTWSNEGANDNDGEGNHSGFTVPFYEYLTSDNASLGAKTLTATLTNLNALDTYEISALVRVRLKDGATDEPTGITLEGNTGVYQGKAVNVCDGALYTYTANGKTQNFYIKKVTTSCMSDIQGRLSIKFVVADDNNISGLSFKNVTYTKKNANYFWIEEPEVAVNEGATVARYCETSSTGSMTVVSNDESIAKAEYREDGNIWITGVAPGTTTIDITQAATDEYVASDVVTINVTVNTSYITETKTFAENGSLCYDYDATVTAGTVYEFTGIYQNQIYGKTVNSITAGKPYIATEGSVTLTRASNASVVSGGSNYKGFHGVAGDDSDVTGLDNDNLIFYLGDLRHASNSTCSKGYGYFVISEIPTDATVTEGAKALFSLELDEPTSINTINSADANASVYNIAGQRVNKAQKGLFIINGKKVVK